MINYSIKLDPLDKRSIELLMSNMKTKLPMYVDVAMHNYSVAVVKSLRKELLIGAAKRGASPRTKLASEIRADRIRRFQYGVFIPERGVALDSMTPHYVSLNKNRVINRWAQKYYGSKKVSGKSRVYFGKFGKLRGGLFVTPDPFIEEGVTRSDNVLDNELRIALEKTFV